MKICTKKTVNIAVVLRFASSFELFSSLFCSIFYFFLCLLELCVIKLFDIKKKTIKFLLLLCVVCEFTIKKECSLLLTLFVCEYILCGVVYVFLSLWTFEWCFCFGINFILMLMFALHLHSFRIFFCFSYHLT